LIAVADFTALMLHSSPIRLAQTGEAANAFADASPTG